MKIRTIALGFFLCTAVPLLPLEAETSEFPMSEVASEELLRFAEDRVGVYAQRETLDTATRELVSRRDQEQSPYLKANNTRVQTLLAQADQYALRWKMEAELYNYQQEPAALISDIHELHHPLSHLQDLPEAEQLVSYAQENLSLALHLLAIFGAYELSLGEFDSAQETLLLHTELPADVPEQELARFSAMLRTLTPALQDYKLANRRLPIPEIFFSATGFGISAAAIADLAVRGFSLPFYPGDSSARTVSLAGSAVGSGLLGFAAIRLPSLLRQSPIVPLTEYLTDEWGHVIDGAMQIFEDYRHQPDQLIVTTLAENHYVVFAESTEPQELPGVFRVARSGRFRIQVSRGAERLSTPAVQLHTGINLAPLILEP